MALAVTVAGVLSAEECQAVIRRIDEAGPTVAPITTATGFEMRPDVRNDTRVIFDDVELPPVIVGMALLFQHRLLHEGCVVHRGVKYALRSDIMYRRP